MAQPERTNLASRYACASLDPQSARDNITAWKRLAACADHDPAEFFPVGKGPEAINAAAAAKAVCARCPVRDLCAEFALCTNQEYGIWGGLDEDERRAIRRARRHNPASPSPRDQRGGYEITSPRTPSSPIHVTEPAGHRLLPAGAQPSRAATSPASSTDRAAASGPSQSGTGAMVRMITSLKPISE